MDHAVKIHSDLDARRIVMHVRMRRFSCYQQTMRSTTALAVFSGDPVVYLLG